MLSKRNLTIVALVAVFAMTAVSCSWWDAPVDPGIVDNAEVVRNELETDAKELQLEVDRLEMQPDLTAEERSFLASARAGLKSFESKLRDVEAFIANEQVKIDDSTTNGELVLTVAGIVGTIFGVPYVPLLANLFKKSKVITSLVSNFDESETPESAAAKGETKTIDKKVLRKLNEASGVQDTVMKAKAKA